MDMLLAGVVASDYLPTEARSALPDAPVVSDGREPRAHRPRAARSRSALAHGLERLAAVVAPSPNCDTARTA